MLLIHINSKVTFILYLLICSFFLLSCQSQQGNHDLSQWRVADWVMQHALDPEGPSIENLKPYISEKAVQELTQFKEILQPDRGLGVLTLNHKQGKQWIGRYAYLKTSWPMALNMEMSSAKGFWQIKSFPFIGIYTKLANMMKPGGLPQAQNGEVWQGGLISYDQSGRPQAEVMLTWLPPFVFIDGVPLQGQTSKKKVINAIQHAFNLREEMAQKAQANYLKRLTLCLPSTSSFSEVIKLISWGEELGADVTSLLARNQQSDAILIRLAKRVPSITLLQSQRIAKSHINKDQITLVSPEEKQNKTINNQTKKSWSIQSSSQAIRDGSLNEKILNTQQEGEVFKTLNTIKLEGTLTGIYITADQNQTYAEVVAWIDLLKNIDPKMPITIGIQPSANGK